MTETKNLNEYEFRTYKTDRRMKKGEKFAGLYTMEFPTPEAAKTYFDSLPNKVGYRREYNPKWVMRKNLISGLEYCEAWDTPAYLSPSCESYWSR